MNDFTKEELQFLEQGVYMIKVHNSGNYGDESDYLEAKRLEQKIKDMIADYCEHENTGSVSDVDYVYFCRKRDRITGVS